MMELTTSVMLLLTMFYGPATAGATSVKSSPVNNPAAIEDSTIVDSMALQAPAGNSKRTVEDAVRAYFKDAPVLADIAKCESQFRQLGADGEVIRGEAVPSDVGVMQINESYHQEEATALGLDLKTLRGNMAFAKWLYDNQGTAPWQSSSACWQKYQKIALK